MRTVLYEALAQARVHWVPPRTDGNDADLVTLAQPAYPLKDHLVGDGNDAELYGLTPYRHYGADDRRSLPARLTASATQPALHNLKRDRSIMCLLAMFKEWHLAQAPAEQTPLDIFHDAIEKSSDLSLNTDLKYDTQFEEVFLDICLYKHEELVQSALDVLMLHHSTHHLLLDDLQQTHLEARVFSTRALRAGSA